MFWQNYEILCRRVGLTPNAVANELHISSGSVTNWKNGKTPSNRLLKTIADYFGVSTEELMTGIKEKTATISSDGQERDELKRLIDRLTDQEVHEILVQVRAIILG